MSTTTRWIASGVNSFRNSRRHELSSVSTGCPPTPRSRSMPSRFAISARRKSIVPAWISAEFAGDCRHDGRQPALPVRIVWRRHRERAVCPRIRPRRCNSRSTTCDRPLLAAGLDFRHVVFVNPYLTGKASRQMNAIYAKHFEFGNTPARATITGDEPSGRQHHPVHGRRRSPISRIAARFRPKNMRPSATASPCVFADDTYYCSAKGPFTPGPATDQVQGICVGTVEAQVRQSMRNLLDGLEEAGLTLCERRRHQRVPRRHERLRANEPCLRAVLSRSCPTARRWRQLAPMDRTPRNEDMFPGLEQISLIAREGSAPKAEGSRTRGSGAVPAGRPQPGEPMQDDTSSTHSTTASRGATCSGWATSRAAGAPRGAGRAAQPRRPPDHSSRARDLSVDRRRARHQLPRHVHHHRRLGGAAGSARGDGRGVAATTCRSTSWPTRSASGSPS